ncbi:hypothetical protein NLG97_g7411 [Lecanicillium saksenae]|uniref:Uncharacterized protein n=1 Tax=Lecanicillium saksenae TaxID=468837 RepID=A0ACC1QN11_9HYPO|nr:hypothetical protein NLG97_g7411 [Lecanicillium saksenae]
MKIQMLIGAALTLVVSAHQPVIYLIRHAEKNDDGTLSEKGLARAKCIENIFGKDSEYNIQKIITQEVWPGDSWWDRTSQRPYNTTLPLAQSLNQTIETECSFYNIICAEEEIRRYDGPGNVLVGWEHVTLSFIAFALTGKFHAYPSDRFDLIYKLEYPYDKITLSSEKCSSPDLGNRHHARNFHAI